ncbi:MAG: putative DNA binding domain-containing protein [Anaerolineales bacterium]|nr:putative DNA binding domain-containing protein [Anaerolineales bacterium]
MARKRTINRSESSRKWYSIDLHLHTPASSDYQQPEISYLDILQHAEKRGLDIIAFTDHNTVAGYQKMISEIEHLELLNSLNRILPEEAITLKEYRRLLNKILVLPGFEFTATFGFHILGIFPLEKTTRDIEHILLQLNIPPEKLDEGSVTVGASADVITAYQVISAAGGLAIAAHANSNNGVAMRGFPFGGQTKIAYTQHEQLAALEVTDLEKRGRHTTAAFFRGTKPEYPRQMHCIQGSDAHRLTGGGLTKSLGVGDRVTEVLLPDRSFDALKDLFASNDFARTRPRKGGGNSQPEFDFIRAAREEGGNIIQDFHESMTVRGGKLYAIIADICAFANANGGTLYLGLSSDESQPVVGISNPSQAIKQIEKEINTRISPELVCTVDSHKTGDKTILRVLVPRGEDPPYAVDDNKIYVRDEGETILAVRDEIVSLVRRGSAEQAAIDTTQAVSLVQRTDPAPDTEPEPVRDKAPRTGVEVVKETERNGQKYYALRDLRNGNVVQNVTVKSARRLWHYAITTYASHPKDVSQANFKWQGNYGVMKQYKHSNRQIFDLIQRDGKKYRYYYGVTEDGIHSEWRKLVGLEEE